MFLCQYLGAFGAEYYGKGETPVLAHAACEVKAADDGYASSFWECQFFELKPVKVELQYVIKE